MDFVIAANTTNGNFASRPLILTGTVAGILRVTATIAGGPSGILLGTAVVRAVPPQLSNVVTTSITNGFEVQVTGYSPDRRIISADFGFDIRTAEGIQKVTLTRNVDTDFSNWYRSPNSTVFGSSFVYSQTFFVEGDKSAIEAVSVTLTNAQGATSSAPVTVRAN
jgi:hypothetical protein